MSFYIIPAILVQNWGLLLFGILAGFLEAIRARASKRFAATPWKGRGRRPGRATVSAGLGAYCRGLKSNIVPTLSSHLPNLAPSSYT